MHALSVFVLLFAVVSVITTKPGFAASPNGNTAAFCNMRGTVQCSCNPGYSGQTCATAIDYCNEVVTDFDNYLNSSTTIGDICSSHGYCVSCTHGAHCQCHPRFQGQFCDQTVDGSTGITTRCALYNTTSVMEPPCAHNRRCVPDNLNCLFPSFHCPSPIGWCFPEGHAHRILAKISSKVSSMSDRSFEDNDSAQSQCSGNGQASCTCAPGFTGNRCQNTINWCDQLMIEPFGPAPLPLSILCLPHGTCNSDPVHGASCHCDPGWAGQFCHFALTNQTLISSRCCLYKNLDSAQCQTIRTGCDTGFTCLTDNLNCAFETCNDPIGWCIPIAGKECNALTSPLPITTSNPAVPTSILVVGGSLLHSASASVTVYNPIDGLHTSLAELPNPRASFVLTQANDSLVLIGGGLTSIHGEINANKTLIIGSDGETMTIPLQYKHTWAAGGKIGNQHIICGGILTYSHCEKLNMDTLTWSPAPSMPNGGKQGAAYAVFNNNLYIVGGADNTGTITKTMHMYDSLSNTWSQLSSMKIARYACSAAVYNSNLIVCGGSFGRTMHNTCEEYSFKSNTWSDVPGNMIQPRAFHGMIAAHGYLYAIGGNGGHANPPIIISDAEKYDGNRWTHAFDLVQPVMSFGVGLY